MEKVLVSTLQAIDGYAVKEHKGLVWTSTARSKNVIQDFAALTRSLSGGDSHHYRHLLSEARKDIVDGLVEQARSLGANAILGVQMGSTQISPAIMDIFAYGSAVVLEKRKK
ncbi:MAG TPA: YbjQ family protein [Candidatus Norongarragalinales archaeon]|nr:YbjQ family protein [Candidatus Norongarragalinales archaeon]